MCGVARSGARGWRRLSLGGSHFAYFESLKRRSNVGRPIEKADYHEFTVTREKDGSMRSDYDVVVVGAGAYGLSTAAHLHGRGLKVAIFGKPLEMWRDHMPKG